MFNRNVSEGYDDEVAEWLRRWTANPMGSARVGSNPILVVTIFYKKNLQLLVKLSDSRDKLDFDQDLCEEEKKSKRIPLPGIEPGPAGWEPAILTTRP